MADTPIYRRTYPKEPWRDQANRYGERYYFFGNRLEGSKQYQRLQDNIDAELARHINAAWTFQGAWQPEVLLGQIRQSFPL